MVLSQLWLKMNWKTLNTEEKSGELFCIKEFQVMWIFVTFILLPTGNGWWDLPSGVNGKVVKVMAICQ